MKAMWSVYCFVFATWTKRRKIMMYDNANVTHADKHISFLPFPSYFWTCLMCNWSQSLFCCWVSHFHRLLVSCQLCNIWRERASDSWYLNNAELHLQAAFHTTNGDVVADLTDLRLIQFPCEMKGNSATWRYWSNTDKLSAAGCIPVVQSHLWKYLIRRWSKPGDRS